MSGRDHLQDFLIAEARRPWRDGDCGVMLALWFRARGGDVPDRRMAAYRDMIADRFGDMYRAVRRACWIAGLEETLYPKRGDVALIRAGNAVLAAICTGDGWASKTKTGLLIVKQAAVIKAWKVA